jgi:anti-sigma28 factor (negative regulator of flagellin synthesis)
MRVNPILGSAAQQIQKVKKVDASPSEQEVRGDSVQISSEARDLQKIQPVDTSSDAARLERLEDIKAKVAEGYYNSRQAISEVAEKIISAFGI